MMPKQRFVNYKGYHFSIDGVLSVVPSKNGGTQIRYVGRPDMVIRDATPSEILRVITEAKADADSD